MAVFGVFGASAHAGCLAPGGDEEAFQRSQAVAKVQVMDRDSFAGEDGLIRTRYRLALLEAYKGRLEREFEVVTLGGIDGKMNHHRSDFLDLEEGKSYALMLDQDAEGGWKASGLRAVHTKRGCGEMCGFFRNGARGKRPGAVEVQEREEEFAINQAENGIPGSRITPSGYVESNGQPARHTICDSGEPIGYLVDVDVTKLPPGMNEAGALAAVAEAMDAWAGASSLKFRFEGIQSFGAAADAININDGKLRIQLHDNFNAVNGSGILGIGGGLSRISPDLFTGGIIGSQGFQERLSGYVVMESVTNAALLQNVGRYKRVLTHEIGHALGLAHSSEDPNEPEPILKNATMYYLSNTDGASIGEYDIDRIQYGYPANTPPYATDRAISVVTTDPSFGTLPAGVLGLNRLRLRAFDRQGGAPTPILVSSTSGGGTFTLDGMDLVFTPSGFFDAARLSDTQIGNGSFYDVAVIQFSDGVNRSRPARFSVVGLHADQTPSDGLPDDWMIVNFGSNAPGALGSGRHPDDDPDKDGLTNRLEFQLNTNPNDAASGPVRPVYDASTRRFTFAPVRFAPYWVESSLTLGDGSWVKRRVATMYQPSQDISVDFTGDAQPQEEYYRVATGF